MFLLGLWEPGDIPVIWRKEFWPVRSRPPPRPMLPPLRFKLNLKNNYRWFKIFVLDTNFEPNYKIFSWFWWNFVPRRCWKTWFAVRRRRRVRRKVHLSHKMSLRLTLLGGIRFHNDFSWSRFFSTQDWIGFDDLGIFRLCRRRSNQCCCCFWLLFWCTYI